MFSFKPHDAGKVEPQALVASLHLQSSTSQVSAPALTVHPFAHTVPATGTSPIAVQVYSVLGLRAHVVGNEEPQASVTSWHLQSSGTAEQVSSPEVTTIHPFTQSVPTTGSTPAAAQV